LHASRGALPGVPSVILDSLANAPRYAALGKGIARAFEFLAKPETARLEPRQSGAANSLMKPIVGDDVFALVQRYQPKLRSEAFWEAHRTYIDVQCVIAGAEIMGWSPLESMGVQQAYDAGRDYIVLESQRGGDETSEQFFTVRAGMFAIFFPTDAHMPGIALESNPNGEVKKIVVKVRA
jgi:biofilm protein TabA